jgi:hypothetical protein
MLDILLAVGQFLSVMGLVYGLWLSLAYRESAELRPVRAVARGERFRSQRPLRTHRAASRAVVSR